MGSRVAGKVALVTGGAAGMGAAHVRALAREGATVVIADLAAEAGAQLADEIRATGGEAAAHGLDVTDADVWRALVGEVEQAYGRIDVLVNNAGVQVRSVGVEIQDGEWDLVTSVNQRGVFLGMQAVIPGMVERGGGSIVNVASVAALVGLRGSIPYQGSKAAVLGLTRGAASRTGPTTSASTPSAPG